LRHVGVRQNVGYDLLESLLEKSVKHEEGVGVKCRTVCSPTIDRRRSRYFWRTWPFDGVEDRLGVGCLFEGLAEFASMKQLGDVRQGVKMLLELTLRHQKERDQLHGLVVQGIEVEPFARAAEGAGDLVDEVGGGVGDADAENRCRLLIEMSRFLHGGGDGLTVLWFDLPSLDQQPESARRWPPSGWWPASPAGSGLD